MVSPYLFVEEVLIFYNVTNESRLISNWEINPEIVSFQMVYYNVPRVCSIIIALTFNKYSAKWKYQKLHVFATI